MAISAPFPDVSTQPDKGIEIGGRESAPRDRDRSSLVLASYNIRYGVGSHLISSGLLRKIGINLPRPRAESVAHNLKTAARIFSDNTLLPQPDILALQEADKETGRAGGQHIAAKLASELGVPYVHVGAGIPRGVPPEQREWWLNFEEQIALHDPGDTGVALLSRLPLNEIERIDLPWHQCAWRPRLAMSAIVELREQRVRLFNVHVDPHGPLDNQHQQVEALLDHAERYSGPRVIMGDFNTLSKQKAVEIRKLMESRGYSTPFPTGTATWRGAGLRFHADWIFVNGLEVKRWGVVKPMKVSDHWPIWAEIESSEFRL
ncbi:MAG TPA: endonuclease/exonuclease/phosphatase family protein [Pyrinomonadaceae bacterium]|nr:endonuclease/exonuclease/phosphatase family protein [Pyrinomonadaceae bacterium]